VCTRCPLKLSRSVVCGLWFRASDDTWVLRVSFVSRVPTHWLVAVGLFTPLLPWRRDVIDDERTLCDRTSWVGRVMASTNEHTITTNRHKLQQLEEDGRTSASHRRSGYLQGRLLLQKWCGGEASPPHQFWGGRRTSLLLHAATLTFDLQKPNLATSIGHNIYSLQVSSRLLSSSWDIVVTISDRKNGRKRTNVPTGEPKTPTMPSPTLSNGEGTERTGLIGPDERHI